MGRCPNNVCEAFCGVRASVVLVEVTGAGKCRERREGGEGDKSMRQGALSR